MWILLAQDVKPTRSELMKLKKRIKLATSGHSLLKKKRDGLIMEFFEILKDAKNIRSELVEDYTSAEGKIAVAAALDGSPSVHSAAMAVHAAPPVDVGSKNIMGVVVPRIRSEIIKRHLHERGYGLAGSSARIDEAAYAYETVVDKILKAAEAETTMLRLLDEIDKTKRRVNALEFKVLPTLSSQAAFIALRLEEIERENVFRLKKIKK